VCPGDYTIVKKMQQGVEANPENMYILRKTKEPHRASPLKQKCLWLVFRSRLARFWATVSKIFGVILDPSMQMSE
jgi:hypothetical protein